MKGIYVCAVFGARLGSSPKFKSLSVASWLLSGEGEENTATIESGVYISMNAIDVILFARGQPHVRSTWPPILSANCLTELSGLGTLLFLKAKAIEFHVF